MPTVADVARIWQQAGVSVIPILTNGTKRPAIKWSPYQRDLPTPQEIDQWWGQDNYGLALVCGPVSGNLEMCEIEGRALASPGAFIEILNRIDEGGAGPIMDLLTGPDGYAEDSPSGGMHLLYRIVDHPVPGNTKIASDEDHVVLAETRGHGGYVIVAPTAGDCHPTGEPWRLVNGNYGQLPGITWAERNLLHECLHAALDRTPPPPPIVTRSADGFTDQALVYVSNTNLTPGDDFERQTDWLDILAPHGWQVVMSTRDGERHWVRPGKDPRDGMSATTGRANDRDRLYVFSTSTVFQSEVPYTKFGAYSLLNHEGDHSRAASALVRMGFGERRSIESTVDVGEWVPPRDEPEEVMYPETDAGNAYLLAATVKGRYRFIKEEKSFYRWDGTVWLDASRSIVHEWLKLTKSMDNKKWAERCQGLSRINSAINLAETMLEHSSTEWAPNRDLINCRNGILDLKEQKLFKHDPVHLLTKTMGASYNPDATCPTFRRFMADAIPNEEMRAYVQRALGYSLLGRADRRSVFLIHGPSGTGKSTLIETINLVLGDYAGTAGSGTFRLSNNTNGPSPDLHMLRGKRFVSTSETAESAQFDEDLLKRMSGRDEITSRGLYEKPVTWTPECTIWIATNNPPRFNSDDNAIWSRTKLIPFTTVFQGEHEIPDYAGQVLAVEASGILNWMLEGLASYLANGLQEPAEVEQLAIEQRNDSDSVARFVQDCQADGLISVGNGLSVGTTDLFQRYSDWSKRSGEKVLGPRRFSHRLESLLPVQRQALATGKVVWTGISYQTHGWMTGPPAYLSD